MDKKQLYKSHLLENKKLARMYAEIKSLIMKNGYQKKVVYSGI